MLSIILLVWREAEKTKECIDRILKLTDTPFELIIIDNNSEQKIKDYIYNLKDNRIKIITHQINEGIAKSYNIGAKASSGEYLAYINSDYYVTDNWASQMIKCLETTKAGMIGPMCNATGNRDQFILNQYQLPLRYIKTTHITNLMFLTKKVYQEVRGFDENFNPLTYDDLDMAEKIKAIGRKIYIDGYTFHWHDYNLTKENEDFIKIREKNKLRFRQKWGNKIADYYDNLAYK